MRIHQITHLFSPDQLAGASLYTDLARFFRDKGHDVRVTTTFSYYPALRYQPEDRWILWRGEMIEHIPVRRVGMILPAAHSGWRRLVPEATYLAALLVRGRFPRWVPDVVVTSSPMLSQVTWQRVAYMGRVASLVILQDSMAHAAVELGIIRNRALAWALHAVERWSLCGVSQISTISEPMRERVNQITGGLVPCVVTPNWIHQSLAEEAAKRRSRSRSSRLIFYSGNFGVKQGLPRFLDDFRVARGRWSLEARGGGPEVDAVARKAAGGEGWLRIGPLLDEGAYVDRLLGSTACLVTQQSGVGANFLPSKLLPALATGTPVLAVCDQSSPLGQEVKDGGFGAIVAPGDVPALSAVLARWAETPGELAALSANASARAKLYSREVICGSYEQQLIALHSAKIASTSPEHWRQPARSRG